MLTFHIIFQLPLVYQISNMQKGIYDNLKAIRESPSYNQPIQLNLELQKIPMVKYEQNTRQEQFLVGVPEIKFKLSETLLQRIANDLERSRKDRYGVLMAYGGNLFDKIQYFEGAEEDIGSLQEGDESFCVGVFIAKTQSMQELQHKVQSQLHKCMNSRLNIYFQKNHKREESLSTLDQVTKTKYRNFRAFIILEKKGHNSYLAHRLFYYPRVRIVVSQIKFIIRKKKVTPSKYVWHQQLENRLKSRAKLDFDYGYIIFGIDSKNQPRFGSRDKDDPDLVNNKQCVVGVWLMGEFVSQLQKEEMIWVVIMEFLRNAQIKRKFSLNEPKTGVLVVLEKTVRNRYIFEIGEHPKWEVKIDSNMSQSVPEEYILSEQGVIFEEDREESDIESLSLAQKESRDLYHSQRDNMQQSQRQKVQDNQLEKFLYESKSEVELYSEKGSGKANEEKGSQKAYDEKDVEIMMLKRELAIYKDKCKELEQMLYRQNNGYMHQQSNPLFPTSPINPSQNPFNILDGMDNPNRINSAPQTIPSRKKSVELTNIPVHSHPSLPIVPPNFVESQNHVKEDHEDTYMKSPEFKYTTSLNEDEEPSKEVEDSMLSEDQPREIPVRNFSSEESQPEEKIKIKPLKRTESEGYRKGIEKPEEEYSRFSRFQESQQVSDEPRFNFQKKISKEAKSNKDEEWPNQLINFDQSFGEQPVYDFNELKSQKSKDKENPLPKVTEIIDEVVKPQKQKQKQQQPQKCQKAREPKQEEGSSDEFESALERKYLKSNKLSAETPPVEPDSSSNGAKDIQSKPKPKQMSPAKRKEDISDDDSDIEDLIMKKYR